MYKLIQAGVSVLMWFFSATVRSSQGTPFVAKISRQKTLKTSKKKQRKNINLSMLIIYRYGVQKKGQKTQKKLLNVTFSLACQLESDRRIGVSKTDVSSVSSARRKLFIRCAFDL